MVLLMLGIGDLLASALNHQRAIPTNRIVSLIPLKFLVSGKSLFKLPNLRVRRAIPIEFF